MATKVKRGNIFGRFFERLSFFISSLLPVRVLIKFFTSYRKWNEKLFLHEGKKRGARSVHNLRRALAFTMERNAFLRVQTKFLRYFFSCSMRTVGSFFLAAGTAVGALAYFGGSLPFGGFFEDALLSVGIAGTAVGVLCLFFDCSAGYLLKNGFLFRILLEGVLGFSWESGEKGKEKGKHRILSALSVGFLFGLICSALPFYAVAIVVGVVALVSTVLSTPESGILLFLLFLPFAGLLEMRNRFILGFVFLLLLAYLCKWMRGNRTFRLELQDYTVLLLLLLFSVFAFLSGGELRLVFLLNCALALAYFLTVNLIATPAWLTRIRATLITAGSAASIFGIMQFALRVGNSGFDAAAAYVKAGFDSNVILAYFLVISFSFAFPSLFTANRRLKIPLAFSCLILTVGIVLTNVIAARLSLLFILLSFLFIMNGRRWVAVLLCCGILTGVYFLLPDFIVELLRRVLIPSSVTFAKNAQYTKESGICLLIAVAFIGIFFLQNCFSGIAESKKISETVFSAVGICLMAGLLCFDLFCYAWNDPAALALFFVAVAIVGAGLRYGRRHSFGFGEEHADQNRAELDYRRPLHRN